MSLTQLPLFATMAVARRFPDESGCTYHDAWLIYVRYIGVDNASKGAEYHAINKYTQRTVIASTGPGDFGLLVTSLIDEYDTNVYATFVEFEASHTTQVIPPVEDDNDNESD